MKPVVTLKPKPIRLTPEEQKWLAGVDHPEIERGSAFVCSTCCSRRVVWRVGARLYCAICQSLGARKARIWAESPVLRKVA